MPGRSISGCVDDDHLDGNVGQKQQQQVQREPPRQAEGRNRGAEGHASASVGPHQVVVMIIIFLVM